MFPSILFFQTKTFVLNSKMKKANIIEKLNFFFYFYVIK